MTTDGSPLDRLRALDVPEGGDRAVLARVRRGSSCAPASATALIDPFLAPYRGREYESALAAATRSATSTRPVHARARRPLRRGERAGDRGGLAGRRVRGADADRRHGDRGRDRRRPRRRPAARRDARPRGAHDRRGARPARRHDGGRLRRSARRCRTGSSGSWGTWWTPAACASITPATRSTTRGWSAGCATSRSTWRCCRSTAATPSARRAASSGNLSAREAAWLATEIGAGAVVPMHHDLFARNRGYPAHLVESVERDHPGVSVLVPVRERPFVWSSGRRR